MIIVNGTIEPKEVISEGGIDPETRYPKKAETRWGDPIPCQFIPAKQNYLQMIEGEHYTQMTWTILIEQRPIEAGIIRLKRRDGTEVGEYSVQAIEHLDAVCETRLTV